jgi:SAM-dependent methyltransferase
VLVARGGGGRICEALVDQGLDAYLVEPDPDASFDASAAGLDARPGHPGDHLRALPHDTLAAIVLVGDPDDATPTAKVALASAAFRALRPGGVLVVLSTDPASWGQGATAIAADLALGRPWRATTWTAVLSEIGFAVAPTKAPKGTIVTVGRSVTS